MRCQHRQRVRADRGGHPLTGVLPDVPIVFEEKWRPVIALDGVGLVRKPESVQRAIKPISRSVPGKDASCSVSAMRCRRESYDQQACV